MEKPSRMLRERERQLLERARRLVYHSTGDGEDLAIHFYFPRDFEDRAELPLFLFFPGGAWDRSSLVQFAPHALYYVDRGAVCGLVSYRTRESHPGATPADAFRDARAAIRFARSHAADLHADPGKLVAVGAGSGGSLAASAAMGIALPGEPRSSAEPDSRPNAVVLLSSIIDVPSGGHVGEAFPDSAERKLASLSRHVSPGLPPMLMIHGTEDRLVPFEEASRFADLMKRKKNPFRLAEFEGRDRNFFNFNTDPLSYEATLSTVNSFLDEHGILAGEDEDGSRVVSWREEDY